MNRPLLWSQLPGSAEVTTDMAAKRSPLASGKDRDFSNSLAEISCPGRRSHGAWAEQEDSKAILRDLIPLPAFLLLDTCLLTLGPALHTRASALPRRDGRPCSGKALLQEARSRCLQQQRGICAAPGAARRDGPALPVLPLPEPAAQSHPCTALARATSSLETERNSSQLSSWRIDKKANENRKRSQVPRDWGRWGSAPGRLWPRGDGQPQIRPSSSLAVPPRQRGADHGPTRPRRTLPEAPSHTHHLSQHHPPRPRSSRPWHTQPGIAQSRTLAAGEKCLEFG
ncbi:uncharacterized protein LOC134522228 [Chroicocephalus ridibundus]|uniref:uncharacterized protein LOC134522228 n=1 Tax=Chroicocephalus ridibundus TaxID=1192867 RepID=UPI002FDC7D10